MAIDAGLREDLRERANRDKTGSEDWTLKQGKPNIFQLVLFFVLVTSLIGGIIYMAN